MADAYQVAKLVWLVIFLELRELYKKKISKVPTLTQYTMHLKQESSHLRPKVPKIQHNIQQSNLKHTIFGHKLKHNHLTRWIFYGILCQNTSVKKNEAWGRWRSWSRCSNITGRCQCGIAVEGTTVCHKRRPEKQGKREPKPVGTELLVLFLKTNARVSVGAV